MKQALAVVAAVCAVGATPAALQQATFRGGTRTVAVYATVTEPGGRLIPDLRESEFQIQDNGKPQAMSVFANDVQPITVVMMLDRSVSMRGNFELVEQA